mmetsp:Transcript_152259/g.277010  ORF Transcript_152259/g.277010 Transcript_152259/m.277010 type:complete len:396 (-) Transcript_152259:601-1788(-)
MGIGGPDGVRMHLAEQGGLLEERPQRVLARQLPRRRVRALAQRRRAGGQRPLARILSSSQRGSVRSDGVLQRFGPPQRRAAAVSVARLESSQRLDSALQARRLREDQAERARPKGNRRCGKRSRQDLPSNGRVRRREEAAIGLRRSQLRSSLPSGRLLPGHEFHRRLSPPYSWGISRGCLLHVCSDHDQVSRQSSLLRGTASAEASDLPVPGALGALLSGGAQSLHQSEHHAGALFHEVDLDHLHSALVHCKRCTCVGSHCLRRARDTPTRRTGHNQSAEAKAIKGGNRRCHRTAKSSPRTVSTYRRCNREGLSRVEASQRHSVLQCPPECLGHRRIRRCGRAGEGRARALRHMPGALGAAASAAAAAVARARDSDSITTGGISQGGRIAPGIGC